MRPHIRLGIRIFPAFQERNPQHIFMRAMPIFAVVQKAYTIAVLRQVRPFMGNDFKTRPIPAGIKMRWPFDMPVLNVIGRFCCANGHRERRFQQAMTFLPIDASLKINAPVIGIENYVLLKPGMTVNINGNEVSIAIRPVPSAPARRQEPFPHA